MHELGGLDARMIRRTGAEGAIRLSKRRTWYAGEDEAADAAQDADGSDAEDISSLPAWAQKQIKDLRKEAADHRFKTKAAKEEAARAAADAEEKRLADEKKWEALAEKRKSDLDDLLPVKERAAALEAKISATNQKRIDRIPEAMRSVIPADYPPDKLSEWLDANESLLTKAPTPNLDGGKRGDGGSSTTPPKLTDVELEMARIAGMKPEDYAKFRDMRGQPVDVSKLK